MDGLFAFSDLNKNVTRTCRFPFGSPECQQVLEKLRQHDPAFDDVSVPGNPLPTIAPEDQPLAYHFLLRALFAVLAKQAEMKDAVPYLMAFSELAKIRFAVVELRRRDERMDIMTTPLDETDFDLVQKVFQGMAAPSSGLLH
jgi:hypothetical protein